MRNKSDKGRRHACYGTVLCVHPTVKHPSDEPHSHPPEAHAVAPHACCKGLPAHQLLIHIHSPKSAHQTHAAHAPHFDCRPQKVFKPAFAEGTYTSSLSKQNLCVICVPPAHTQTPPCCQAVSTGIQQHVKKQKHAKGYRHALGLPQSTPPCAPSALVEWSDADTCN